LSTYPAPPAPAGPRPRILDWLIGSFWVADAVVLGMLAFFVVLGAGGAGYASPVETTGFAIVLGGLLLMLALHLARLHRHRAELERSPSSRHDRERRGF
jgi:predicted phage tail protein